MKVYSTFSTEASTLDEILCHIQNKSFFEWWGELFFCWGCCRYILSPTDTVILNVWFQSKLCFKCCRVFFKIASVHRKWVTCELHDSYFRSTMIKHAIPKTAEVAYSVGQLWEEIAWARRRVHISSWEFDGNIRPTIWTEDSEILLFTQSCPVVIPCAFSRPSSNLHRRVQAS